MALSIARYAPVLLPRSPNLPCFKIGEDWDAKAEMKGVTDGALYQMSFSPNCIWRDVVAVEVRTPAEEIGAPWAPNKLVLLVGTTGDARFV